LVNFSTEKKKEKTQRCTFFEEVRRVGGASIYMASCGAPIYYIYTHMENNCICVGERLLLYVCVLCVHFVQVEQGEGKIYIHMESSSSSSKYDFDAMELEDEEKLQVCV
jgi:hypothetical protein